MLTCAGEIHQRTFSEQLCSQTKSICKLAEDLCCCYDSSETHSGKCLQMFDDVDHFEHPWKSYYKRLIGESLFHQNSGAVARTLQNWSICFEGNGSRSVLQREMWWKKTGPRFEYVWLLCDIKSCNFRTLFTGEPFLSTSETTIYRISIIHHVPRTFTPSKRGLDKKKSRPLAPFPVAISRTLARHGPGGIGESVPWKMVH